MSLTDFLDYSQGTIPHLLHQMWLGKDDDYAPMPAKYDEFVERMKEVNSNWTYKLWKFADVHQLFRDFPQLERWRHFYYHVLEHHIEKCDFARYMIMYCIGGVYADADTKALKNYDTILIGRIFAVCRDWIHNYNLSLRVFEDEPAVFNGFLASAPNQPIWARLMDYIMYTYKHTNKKLIMSSSGPISCGNFFEINGIYDEENYPELFIDRCLIIPQGQSIQKVRRGIPEPVCDPSEAITEIHWSAAFDLDHWALKSAPSYLWFRVEKSHFVIICCVIVLAILLAIVWFFTRKREQVCQLNLTSCELKKNTKIK